MQPLDAVRRYPLFNLLQPQQLEIWVSAGQEFAFAVGEPILQEGSAGVWIYLVLDGRVRIVRRSKDGKETSVGTLGRGEIFGEYALLPPHRNTATCRAASAVRLLRLPLLPLKPVLAAIAEVGANLKNWVRLHALLGYLRQQAFLGFMSAPSALKYLDSLQPVPFRALETIQADGLSADCWFYVETGQVGLFAPAGAASVPPRQLGPGDCFGEQALLGRHGLAIAVAQTDARCLSLARTNFASTTAAAGVSMQSLLPNPNTLLKAYVWVGQREEADCGIAALAMIARFHGVKVSMEQLRGQVSANTQGANLIELQQACTSLGLRCLAVRVEAERLSQVKLPAIIHLHSGHYVVLYENTTTGVVVGDPATAIVRLSRDAFNRLCSGNLLLVEPK